VLAEICGLSPVGDWKTWRDDAGHTVKLLKNSSVRIYPTKTPDETTTSDIFAKALPQTIARKSYWVMFLSNDSENVTCFVGRDGRLRISRFKDGAWAGNYAPLLIGYGALKVITRGYMESDVRALSPIPSTKLIKAREAVTSGWPTKDDTLRGKIQCLISPDTKV
jgi:hypothetical protein